MTNRLLRAGGCIAGLVVLACGGGQTASPATGSPGASTNVGGGSSTGTSGSNGGNGSAGTPTQPTGTTSSGGTSTGPTSHTGGTSTTGSGEAGATSSGGENGSAGASAVGGECRSNDDCAAGLACGPASTTSNGDVAAGDRAAMMPATTVDIPPECLELVPCVADSDCSDHVDVPVCSLDATCMAGGKSCRAACTVTPCALPFGCNEETTACEPLPCGDSVPCPDGWVCNEDPSAYEESVSRVYTVALGCERLPCDAPTGVSCAGSQICDPASPDANDVGCRARHCQLDGLECPFNQVCDPSNPAVGSNGCRWGDCLTDSSVNCAPATCDPDHPEADITGCTPGAMNLDEGEECLVAGQCRTHFCVANACAPTPGQCQ